ncbi:hypothetical protein BDN71DRAFT_1514013 [Pleurotus eryngii]|uniref:Uncharacterized protein n=1 Tax=Pleurotus eryngii TaxID=5323 RepID=A0A9P6D887_PLEER|nr:hypothetical protein BDN71DRAFT_1514013 [Pleurotus eryngii]
MPTSWIAIVSPSRHCYMPMTSATVVYPLTNLHYELSGLGLTFRVDDLYAVPLHRHGRLNNPRQGRQPTYCLPRLCGRPDNPCRRWHLLSVPFVATGDQTARNKAGTHVHSPLVAAGDQTARNHACVLLSVPFVVMGIQAACDKAGTHILSPFVAAGDQTARDDTRTGVESPD